MPPEKIDSLADDVKPLVLGLLRQISELTARVDELLGENKALRARIAELEARQGKPASTSKSPAALPGYRDKPSRRASNWVAEMLNIPILQRFLILDVGQCYNDCS
jgi:regulator of replication initiation timing